MWAKRQNIVWKWNKNDIMNDLEHFKQLMVGTIAKKC